MTTRKKRLPGLSFWTIEDLAFDLNISPDALHVYAADGLLMLTDRTLGGTIRCGVTAEEKRRFEGEGVPSAEQYNAVERESHLYLIGALSAMWCIGDPYYEGSHYRIRDLIAGDAAAKGFPMLRSRETDANAIKEALSLLAVHKNELKDAA